MHMPIPLTALILSILLLLIRQTHQYCSTTCTYQFSSIGNNYVQRCTGITTCTACDHRFYYTTPAGNTCNLLAEGIYNNSILIAQNEWERDYTTTPTYMTVGTDIFWVKMEVACVYTQLLQVTQPHYGLTCRALFHVNGASPTLFFKVNNTFTENVEVLPVTDGLYQLDQWIYTSSFVPFTDQLIRIVFVRTDNGVPDVAFNDVQCLIAYCVPNCVTCTSLRDCSVCGVTFVLNVVTRLCEAACPAGQFGTSGVCQLCDPLCDTCTAAGNTNCINCTDSGPYQSFLKGTTCHQICPGILIPNYLNHTCLCPEVGYYQGFDASGNCVACPTNCKTCNVAGTCQLCYISYFMRNDTTACVSACPAGQYANLIYDIAKCYACTLTACAECVNSSTMCTSCAFVSPAVVRYLYNYTCMALCPDGYEGNNVTFKCDLCPLGMYSFENVCYSECPLYYQANDNIRACVLPGGYPLNMSVSVQTAESLKFTIPLELGLKTTVQTTLNTSWKTYISLTFITEVTNTLVLNQRRLLLSPTSLPMTISNAIINNNSIVLYSNTVSAGMLVYSHSFVARFADNLVSPRDVIYSIRAHTSTDDNVWFVQKYFDLNLKPYYLIGIFLAVFGLLIVLMRTKYIYRIMIEYLHAIQLLGLTYYCIYPHSVSVNLYSFVMGLDFSNFTFLYNVPAKLITPCYDCISLISFDFAIGDMNWLRMMGSLLLCLAAMLLFCGVVYVFRCSRVYAGFFLGLVVDLVIVKTVHGWFASLVYSGLNYKYNEGDQDIYVLGMHTFSYLLLLPVLYTRLKAQYENKHPNISFIFLMVFIILMVLLSLAPTLICALLMLTTFTEWCLIYSLNITEQEIPAVASVPIGESERAKDKAAQQQEQTCTFVVPAYHNYLLRSIKPLTAFLVACIMMVDDDTIPIALVSSCVGLLLILILVDTYLLYDHNEKLGKMDIKPPKSNSIVNETKQDLRQEKETEYRDYQIVKGQDIKIYEQDDLDDDVVANKFRKNKANAGLTVLNASTHGNDNGFANQERIRNNNQLFKNVE